MNGEFGKKISQLVTVQNASRMYMDIASLSKDVHEGHNDDQQLQCALEAHKHRVNVRSVYRGKSVVSDDLNVLYKGTSEYDTLIGKELEEGFDPGVLLMGLYDYVMDHKLSADKVKEIFSRDTLQICFGWCFQGHKAYVLSIGEFSEMHFQNKGALPFFAGEGECMGRAVKAATTIRDRLAQQRGSTERSDPVRNSEFSDSTGAYFKVDKPGTEFAALAFTGKSKTLDEIKAKLLSYLPVEDRKDYENNNWSVSAHMDDNNDPTDDYSRAVIASACGKLERDNPGDQFRCAQINVDRKSVMELHAKRTGKTAMEDVCVDEWKKYETKNGRKHEDNGDTLSRAKVIRLGFVEDEESAAKDDDDDKGPGFWHSYEREQDDNSGEGWVRHRTDDPNSSTVTAAVEESDVDEDELPELNEPEEDSTKKATKGIQIEALNLLLFVTICADLLAVPADPNKFSAISGIVSGISMLRKKFNLSKSQTLELVFCALLHVSKCHGIFLVKCQYLMKQEADSVEGFSASAESGSVGAVFMNLTPPELQSRVSTKIVRTANYHLKNVKGVFTAEFVAGQVAILQSFLGSVEKADTERLPPTTRKLFENFENEFKQLQNIGDFTYLQILPMCYLLGLVDCAAHRAYAAPILDSGKAHYKLLTDELKVPKDHIDRSMEIAGHKYGTHPVKIENTLCEKERGQKNVLDFFFEGQWFYDFCRIAGSTEYAVYMKKWGADGVWTRAVRNPETHEFELPD